jgi:hypothetical protein
MSKSSDKAAANAQAAKLTELSDDLVSLQHFRTIVARQLSKVEDVLDPISDISPRYEHLSSIAFTSQYLLNTRANLIRTLENLDAMIKTVKGEKEKWTTRNRFLLISMKGML